MIHPLIPIIRWWLVALVLLALAAVWPSVGIYAFAGFSWTPLGLMYPTFAPTTPCSVCNSGTQGTTNIQLDVAGVTNNLCSDCANWNTSWIIVFFGGCTYSQAVSPTLCGSAVSASLSFCWDRSCTGNSGVSALMQLEDGGSGTGCAFDQAVSSPRDCQSATGVSSVPCTTNCNVPLRCTYTSATITATPLP